MLREIYIPDLLRLEHQTLRVDFCEFLPDLETLVPVQGSASVYHGGSFLEVVIKAKTIVTLTCDRTLVQFNHRLTVDSRDIVPLAYPTPLPRELELTVDELTESYPPDGFFPLPVWIYEQLCLAIPFPAIAPDAPAWQSPALEESVDHRWDVLRNLRLTE
ncbi:MAG: YceD family protein [Pseudanabaenaceae cyanobacterium SKYGB_i_bin29]|nr:YceD family protein [Pseudanabaenaceae cyanobacterium SKYG29]MDW8421443.1 YceD family protein [Pseudanabaenaceae cyanobacterium SKYGB_i_bin29]